MSGRCRHRTLRADTLPWLAKPAKTLAAELLLLLVSVLAAM